MLYYLAVGARGGFGVAGANVSATLPRGMGIANGTQPVMGFGKYTWKIPMHGYLKRSYLHFLFVDYVA